MSLHLVFTVLATCLLAHSSLAQCTQSEVSPNSVIYHGSPVKMFDWRRTDLNPAPPFNNPPSPDGPAWFAWNWQFSVHAGLRYLQGQSGVSNTLHRYNVHTKPNVLSCPNHAAFSAHTQLSFDNGGDVVAANNCCQRFFFDALNDPGLQFYDGYIIQNGRVRNEPELILCYPSDKLKLTGSEEWGVSQFPGAPGALAASFTGGANDGTLGIGRILWLLKNAGLADFFCQPAEATPEPPPPPTPPTPPPIQKTRLAMRCLTEMEPWEV